MVAAASSSVANLVKEHAHVLTGTTDDYKPLLDLIGDSNFVLLGEASHGTHEFYASRAKITKQLIREKGFNAIAVEADWPDAYRVNRFIRERSSDEEAIEALEDFKRFPTWMWRNADVLNLVGWLREYNGHHAPAYGKVGWYGLDLYSLFRSMEAVLQFLDKVDAEAAARARARYACFDHYSDNSQAYGYAASTGRSKACEGAVMDQLMELSKQAGRYAKGDLDEFFYAQQNARLVRNAEEYYRTMFEGHVDSWNLRDRHMMETLEHLVAHLKARVSKAKIIIWAHNSHLGDARATQMGELGELNLGQLVRQQYPGDAFLVGYTTYSGTVTAASDWDQPPERKRVRPALRGSYESIFHDVDLPRFFVSMRNHQIEEALSSQRLERAIGVVYRPETERASHYFNSSLSGQFDAVLHFDETRAVEPLERTAQWERGEVPETYPFAV
jgi:erythromycin esterase-like protein